MPVTIHAFIGKGLGRHKQSAAAVTKADAAEQAVSPGLRPPLRATALRRRDGWSIVEPTTQSVAQKAPEPALVSARKGLP